MKTYVHTANLYYNFVLIGLHNINYKVFLNAEQPEVKMLADLANSEGADSFAIMERLVQDLNEHTESLRGKYFNQLRIFIQLRSHLENQFYKAMESVSKFFKEEKDFLYRKGVADKSKKVILALISKLDLGDKEIAELVAVPIAFVALVRKEHKK